MRTAFEQVGAINGVLGAYITRQGQIQASSLPLIFRSDVIGAASQPLLTTLLHIAEVSGHVEIATIHFGDVYLVATPLEPELLFVVVGQPHTDLALLRREIQKIRATPLLQASSGSGELKGMSVGEETRPATSSPTQTAESSRAHRSSTDGHAAERPRGVRTSSTIKPLLLEGEVRTRLQNMLAHYVGPVAPLLLEDQLRSGATPAQLVERLGREIESAEDREDFLTRVAELQLWTR